MRVTELTALRGDVRILDRVSLRAGRREIVAVVGRSGAGKTTLLKSIAGLRPCCAAELALDGHSLLGLAPEARSRRGLAYVPQVPSLFRGMTVRENMLLGGWSTRNDDTDTVTALLPTLGPLLDSAVSTLGQLDRRLCAVGRALMTRPTMLLLDDPVRSLTPAEAATLRGFLPDILSAGVSVLFSDHDPEGATAAVDRLYVLDRGVVVCSGTPAGVLTGRRFLGLYGSSRGLAL